MRGRSVTTLYIHFCVLFSVISQKSNFHRTVEDVDELLFVSYMDTLVPTNTNSCSYPTWTYLFLQTLTPVRILHGHTCSYKH